MGILVMTTGGTIGAMPYQDPQHPPEFSTMPSEGQDVVRDVLKTTFTSYNARCLSLEPRDSKLIDEAYRKNIIAVIESSPEFGVLVTHGTDTLLQTADFLHHFFINKNAFEKTILITGSMTPLANGAGSDGYENLAFSLQCLTDAMPALAKVNVVLSDFNESGEWKPQLYPYRPNAFEKFYDADGRYNRLRLKS